MAMQPIRFEDGAAYEQMMGVWSRSAGEIFLDWIAPPSGLRWLDIGCGNGAFTELIIQRCSPAEVQGIDPSEGQLAYARTREAATKAQFRVGQAMALPCPDNSFDAAVMALVIFFVPDPAKGVAEMARVVKPGGTVAAYAWDVCSDGFPWDPMWAGLDALNIPFPRPPSSDASRMERLQQLWAAAGLTSIETREIKVERTFASFDEYWSFGMTSNAGLALAGASQEQITKLKALTRDRLSIHSDGRVTGQARANAVKGRVPG